LSHDLWCKFKEQSYLMVLWLNQKKATKLALFGYTIKDEGIINLNIQHFNMVACIR